MSARRVLLINHAAEMGGSEYGLLDIATYFGARCHVVLFVDGPLRRHLEHAGVGVTVLPGNPRMMSVRREAGLLSAVASAPEVARMGLRLAAIARGYDVLYPNSQKAAVVTMMVARLIGKPVVWHLHDILSPEHFAALQRQLMVRLANFSARTVIAISEASKQSFIACGGDPKRVVVVLNGVDSRRFEAIEAVDVAAMRASLRVGHVKLVGLFGRISPWKGQHVLIAALPALPDVHVLMVGDALFGEQAYFEELKADALRLGVADRIHWLGYRTDVVELMRTVDVVVHASTSGEPFGRVIVEGMLARRPVLATDHGASRELLGGASWSLVPPGDPQALSDRLAYVFALDPAEREQLVRANYERAMALFSLQAMMQGIDHAVELAA